MIIKPLGTESAVTDAAITAARVEMGYILPLRFLISP